MRRLRRTAEGGKETLCAADILTLRAVAAMWTTQEMQ